MCTATQQSCCSASTAAGSRSRARRHTGYLAADLRLADRMTGREQLDTRLVERRDLGVP